MHGKCHGRSNVVLLQTLTTCERVVNKVYPFTEELVSIVLWCTIILAQVQLEVYLGEGGDGIHEHRRSDIQ